jgi:hypothetical protein
MHVLRDGNRVLVTQPLGFDFDDGRLVLSLQQAKELQVALMAAQNWIVKHVEEEEHEDG